MSSVSRIISLAAPVAWGGIVGATLSADGKTLTKTAGAGWTNAGAFGTQALRAALGWTLSVVNDGSSIDAWGFSRADGSLSYDSIEFAGLVNPGASAFVIYESGANPYQISTAPGDVLAVRVDDGVVTYLKNGAVVYTSLVAPTLPLYPDCSLFGVGHTLAATLTQEGTEAVGAAGSVVRI